MRKSKWVVMGIIAAVSLLEAALLNQDQQVVSPTGQPLPDQVQTSCTNCETAKQRVFTVKDSEGETLTIVYSTSSGTHVKVHTQKENSSSQGGCTGTKNLSIHCVQEGQRTIVIME